MSLSVCVSASSTDGALTTTADLRSVLGVSSTQDELDAYQQKVIVRASRWAETYIGQPLLSAVYLESVAGYGGLRILLARTPIRALLRVFDSTDTGSATEYCSTQRAVDDADAGLLSTPLGFAWRPMRPYDLGEGVAPGSEAKTWLVEYQAGYVFPETSSTSYGTTSTGPTLPEDIQHAVLLKAAELVNQDGRIQMKKVGDLAITYRQPGVGQFVRSEAEELLQPYRRVV